MRKGKLFLALFSLSTLLFVLDKKGILTPPRARIERVGNPLRAKVYSLAKKPEEFWESLRVKKEALDDFKKKERELEACRFELKSLKKENEDLRRLLQAPLPKSWVFLPAKVLGQKRYLIIDKGESDGVREEMAVVFENSLVGKIVKISSFSSLVLLPLDSESKIAVKTQNGVRGLLEGRFGTRIFLSHVLQRETFEVGDLVVTTGEGYHADLLVGKIKTKAKESHEPFKEAEVEPLLDYGKLTTVFVVKEP